MITFIILSIITIYLFSRNRTYLPVESMVIVEKKQHKLQVVIIFYLISYFFIFVDFMPEKEKNTTSNNYLFVLDVSGSMKARINNTPRLDTAINYINKNLNTKNNNALITFSEKSIIQSPFTNDTDFIKQRLTEILPQDNGYGTNLGQALETALKCATTATEIYLISDGQNTIKSDLDIKATAKEIAEASHHLNCIGIEGGEAEVTVKGIGGSNITRKVNVNYDEKVLQELAQSGNGKFISLKNNITITSQSKDNIFNNNYNKKLIFAVIFLFLAFISPIIRPILP